eukprot:CAMPEP_0173435032 /NCGR_PEP_ID=MMETSP1357-20121228/14022_1 /TAXON_ID=77926 /ORGANISM="Hemiselmis rufescens, Strain PCC563" /LENGTH=110 /DNA_ID=CAMNT_0014399967 /DNA_START=59 /DNA_END=388 /DNA_ORIENTATION=-
MIYKDAITLLGQSDEKKNAPHRLGRRVALSPKLGEPPLRPPSQHEANTLVVGVVVLVGAVVANTVAVEGAAVAPLVARGGAPRGGEVQGLGGALHELDSAADGSEHCYFE